MKLIRTIKQLWAINARKPIIEISRSGQLTLGPKVHVGLVSKMGATSVLTFSDDDAGNAGAEIYAATMSRITGLSVFDRRPHQSHKSAPCDCCEGVPFRAVV